MTRGANMAAAVASFCPLGGFLQTNKGQLQETRLVLWSPGQHWSSLCANWNLEMCNRIIWKRLLPVWGRRAEQLKETSVHSEVWSSAESQRLHFF